MKARRLARVSPVLLWVGVVVWSAGDIQGAGQPAAAPAAPEAAQVGSTQDQQIEKGRAAVTQICVGCHTGVVRMLERRAKPEQEWRDTVYSMIGRGAQVLPDEIEPITAYLVSIAGPAQAQQAARPQADATGGAAPAAEPGQGAQPAAGAAILAQRCTLCHDAATAASRPTAATWAGVIDDMIAFGASLTPAERQTLIDYLTEQER